MPTYTHIQFIHHTFITKPAEDPDSGKKTYLGIDPVNNDIAARVAFVNQVLQTVKANDNVRHSGDSANTVLKVFMLPEFAFRGPTGAYSMEEAMSLVEKLQQIVKAQEWQHWLFIFGTVVCKSHAAMVPSKINILGKGFFGKAKHGKYTAIDPEAKVEIYNIAPIQKGGFQDNPAHESAHSVMKASKAPGGSDFIWGDDIKDKKGKLTDQEVEALDPLPVPENFSDFAAPQNANAEEILALKYHYIYGDSVFVQDGLTFGLEICIDFGHRHLKRLMSKAEEVLNSEEIAPKELDVHLVTSCGANRNQPRNIAAKEGGFLALCDGISLVNSGVKIMNDEYKNELAKKSPNYADVFSEAECLESTELEIESVQINDESDSVQLSELYPYGAGKVSIYTPQEL